MCVQEFRQKLPSWEKQEEILELIRENQVVVLSGETGCGKTTQVRPGTRSHGVLPYQCMPCIILCVCVYTCVGASVHTRGCSGERVWGSDPDHLHSATENICHLRYYSPVSVCMLGKYIWALFLNLSQSALLAHSYLGHCACMKSHTIRT